ncbi:hypothetical protein OT109_03365 [Phycisphaeraceae bacterium D3-23]
MSSVLPDAKKAATASYVIPILAVAISFFLSTAQGENEDFVLEIAIAQTLAIVLVCLAGVVLAISALFRISKTGPKGVLGPSIAGILLNMFVLILMIGGAMHATKLHAGNFWTKYTNNAGGYSVDLKGIRSEKMEQINLSRGGGTILVARRTGTSSKGRVMMFAEDVLLPIELADASDSDIINMLVDQHIAHWQGQETGRDPLRGGDRGYIIHATRTNPPGRMEFVVRRAGDLVYILAYITEDSDFNEEDLNRFFDSFRWLL